MPLGGYTERAVLVAGHTTTHNSLFLSQRWLKPPLCLSTEGWPGWVGLKWPG